METEQTEVETVQWRTASGLELSMHTYHIHLQG